MLIHSLPSRLVWRFFGSVLGAFEFLFWLVGLGFVFFLLWSHYQDKVSSTITLFNVCFHFSFTSMLFKCQWF